jgi:hypothetical protein
MITDDVAPEPEGSSPHSQQPANGPYPEPGEATPHPPQPISLRSILSPSPVYTLVFQVVFFILVFPPKPCTRFSPLPCVPHAPPNSFSLIWSALLWRNCVICISSHLCPDRNFVSYAASFYQYTSISLGDLFYVTACQTLAHQIFLS